LRLLQEGKHHHRIARYFLQPTIPRKAAALIFITAMFERTTFKYFSRGYRYVLLEAGHVAQNINLVSTALGLVCLNIGGFLDRGIDAFLRLDGVTHSTLYIIAIGGNNHGIRHRAKN
jgi:SagB-type dehydrogenase family enzyme